MNKKTKLILSISIALNILFLSFHFGHVFGLFKPKNFMRENEEKIIQSVSKDKQELVKETFLIMKNAREEKFSLIKKEFEKLEKITTAKEFDKKEFLKKLQKINEISGQMKMQSNVKIAETLAQLSQEDRIKIVAEIKKNKPPHAR